MEAFFQHYCSVCRGEVKKQNTGKIVICLATIYREIEKIDRERKGEREEKSVIGLIKSIILRWSELTQRVKTIKT